MKKFFGICSIIISLVMIIALASVFTSCSSGEKMYLLIYGDYIDDSVYEKFEDETGIKVVVDTYDAPEDMYTKLTSGTAKYDLICASDYIIEKLIKEERLDKLNYENIPNFKNISEKQKEAAKGSYDPDLSYSVPHFWGFLGILYNTERVSEEDAHTWDTLFNGKYSGKIIMPDSERDSMFTALKKLGYDPNTKNKSELDSAADLLKSQVNDVQAYLLDEGARTKIASGNADLAVIYNGEAYYAFEESEDELAFAVPDEGTYIWIDAFAVPKDADHKDYAEKFLNFLCGKEIADINFEHTYYSTPNQAVIDSLDEDVLEEEAIFPDESIYENSVVLNYLGSEIEEYYSKLWKEIVSE